MAGSFMTRLRERVEQLQTELQPEAGFDRRAYGYGDDGEEDATFEEVALEEEESPWRRGPPDPPRPEPAPAAGGPEPAGRAGVREPRGPETPPPRVTSARGSAAARPETFDPFAVRERQTGGGVRRPAPSPPSSRDAPARASARTPPASAPGDRPARHGFEGTGARGASRLQRLRRRIRNPESLRELFLLREVIDRPIALRRPRPPTRPPS